MSTVISVYYVRHVKNTPFTMQFPFSCKGPWPEESLKMFQQILMVKRAAKFINCSKLFSYGYFSFPNGCTSLLKPLNFVVVIAVLEYLNSRL